MKYCFEKKLFDKGIMKIRFNINYWLLKTLGLNGFSFLAFFIGVIITILIYEYLFN